MHNNMGFITLMISLLFFNVNTTCAIFDKAEQNFSTTQHIAIFHFVLIFGFLEEEMKRK